VFDVIGYAIGATMVGIGVFGMFVLGLELIFWANDR